MSHNSYEIEQLVSPDDAQEIVETQAQRATVERNKAADALRAWLCKRQMVEAHT